MISRKKKIIERAFLEYYRDLLGHKRDLEEGFDKEFLLLMPKLDDEVKKGLEEPISVWDIERAIDELGLGKSPGPDGLSAASCKAFKSDLAVVLQRVITEM